MVRQRKKSKTSSSILRQRPHFLTSSLASSLLDVIGIRKIRQDAPLSPAQKSILLNDIMISAAILILAVLTRFYRLAIPDKVVFDEIHFAGFIHQYIGGNYLFDIHPPLGKLTLAAVAKLFGYKHINFSFKSIGQNFGDLVFYPQRAFAALCGSLIPPVMYLTGRSLSLSVIPSLCIAAMPLFDILLCVESRLILTDSQLILYLQAAYLFAFLLWQTPRSTPKRYILLMATATAAAFALSTKWTAFVAPLIIAFVSLTGIIFPYARLDILEMGMAAIVAGVIYTGSFYIHFKLLPLSGEGDAFMKNEFQATLVGNRQYDKLAEKPSFLQNFWYLNWEMLRANSAIKARHPWESKWYEWLYNARGVLYVDENVDDIGDLKQRIYIVINPVLSVITIMGVFISILVVCIKIIKWIKKSIKNKKNKKDIFTETNDSPSIINLPKQNKRYNRTHHHRNNNSNHSKSIDGEKEDKVNQSKLQSSILNYQWIQMLALSFIAWCANLFPYIGISRCTFIYHVLPSLQISSLMTGILLNFLPSKYSIRSISCTVIIVALAASYYRWRPWVYALPRTEDELVALRLMPRWD